MTSEKSSINKTAIIIIAVTFILSGFGFLYSKFKVGGINKAIKGSETVNLDLWLSEVPSTHKDLFIEGEFSNLIIRNRPHGKLKIISSNCIPLSTDRYFLRRVSIPTVAANTEPFKEPFLWQCRLTLQDKEALSTTNGYLSHGNQLKIGTRISLEGALYRVDGYIVDLLPEKNSSSKTNPPSNKTN
ncbi:MAG: DUF4330 family protein [Candidatus Caenarcaniphilales bacterium]|nr:DUF4330 family protein [Candidatus Caenarcaniphilales bacterium]